MVSCEGVSLGVGGASRVREREMLLTTGEYRGGARLPERLGNCRAPVCQSADMQSGNAIEFAHAARTLTNEAQRRGLVGPSFRCPPRIVGVDRSLRRHAGGVTVAVKLRGRPWAAVLADMIEGVVAGNAIEPAGAFRLRAELWSALGFEGTVDVARVA